MSRCRFLQPVNNRWIGKRGKMGQESPVILSDNYRPRVGDLIPGQMFSDFPEKNNSFFYHRVVECETVNEDYIAYIVKTSQKSETEQPECPSIEVIGNNKTFWVLRMIRETSSTAASRRQLAFA
jgi:hypothetical protein